MEESGDFFAPVRRSGSRRSFGVGSHARVGRLGEGPLTRRDRRELADLEVFRRRGGSMWGGKWRVRVEESGEPGGAAAVEAVGEPSGDSVVEEGGGEAGGARGTWENLVWPECRP